MYTGKIISINTVYGDKKIYCHDTEEITLKCIMN